MKSSGLFGSLKRHPWRTLLLVAGLLGVGLLIALASVVPFSSDTARREVVAVLATQLDSEVELAELKIRLLPTFRAEGSGLVVRYKGRHDVPPMIAIGRFSAEGNITDLLHKRIARLAVDRLDVQIPPDRNRGGAAPAVPDRNDPGNAASQKAARAFVIDELITNDGRFVIIPRDPESPPKVWGIHRLRMLSVAPDRAMPFDATLTNAVPPGEVETSGSFGPWQSEQPGATPLAGRFTFARADLSVFSGISGILSSRGSFGGTIERIDIHGTTDTPDFMVASGGHAFPLHADYHAMVDGTNGNTSLQQVNASFLKSSLIAKGDVVRTPGKQGRTVTLDIDMEQARLEDILLMAVNTPKPPMTGALKLTTKFVLPPGDRDVVQKLRLAGRFGISGTRFTDTDVQKKINDLSHKTSGKVTEPAVPNVSSQFTGAFDLSNSRLTIPTVTFDIPGSTVRLAGTYSLVNEQIDFSGTAYTDAKISQMTTGFKSLLLKPIDLIFRKDGGGSAIPVKIGGTRGEPSFGLDKGRIFKRK